MLEKEIISRARKAVGAWLSLIGRSQTKHYYTGEAIWEEEGEIVNLVRNNVMVSGGAIASLLNNETPNDWDFYFKTDAACNRLSEFTDDQFINTRYANGCAGYEHFDPVYVFSAASIEALHAKHDFVHRRLTYDFAEHRLVLDSEALTCLMNKQLRYVSQPYPIASLLTVKKYLERGWTIDLSSLLMLSHDLSKLDWSDGRQLSNHLRCIKDPGLIRCIETQIDCQCSPIGNDFLLAIVEYLDNHLVS